MPKFRKLPVEIEARQWDGTAESAGSIINWILSAGATARYICSDSDRCVSTNGDTPHVIQIVTLEGTMEANLKDYIIKGVKEEFYPCKPDIFEATYEEV